MAKIKDLAKIKEKWARVTPQRSGDYAEGVRDPAVDWATATKAAEERYKDGVLKAANRGAFGKGVARAGTSRWQERSLAVGPGRFAEGVAQAEDRYGDGFAPFASVISSLTLPPRFPKGDIRNLERVKAVSQALRKKKEEQG